MGTLGPNCQMCTCALWVTSAAVGPCTSHSRTFVGSSAADTPTALRGVHEIPLFVVLSQVVQTACCLRNYVPKSIIDVVFEPEVLKSMVSGPSGCITGDGFGGSSHVATHPAMSFGSTNTLIIANVVVSYS